MALRIRPLLQCSLPRKFCKQCRILRGMAYSVTTANQKDDWSRFPKKTVPDKLYLAGTRAQKKENFSAVKKFEKMSYISDPAMWEYIPKALGDQVKSENCAVAVMYPGPGQLTSAILNVQPKNLYLFEPNAAFREANVQIANSAKGIRISNEKFFRELALLYEPDGELEKLLTREQYSQLKIITAISGSTHLRQIIYDLVNGVYKNTYNCVEFYFVANEVTAPIIDSAKPGSRRRHNYWLWMLWRFFTKTEKLATFSPREENKGNKEIALFRTTYQLWPMNYRMPSFSVTEREQQMLCMFVRTCLNDPGGLVIATLEKLSPQIGLHVLRSMDNINLHSKFSQVAPEDLLLVYEIFRKFNLNNSRVWQFMDTEWDFHK